MRKDHGIFLLGITILASFAVSPPAEGAVSWYGYTVECRDYLTTNFNLKSGACGNKCFEGHDCTACAGWEVRQGWGGTGPLRQAGTKDKVRCCFWDGRCGFDERFSSICGISSTCPANGCPGYTFWKSVWVVHHEKHQCSPGPTSLDIPVQRLAVGIRTDNTPWCGSACGNSDPFTQKGNSDLAFAYFANWNCDGQDHTDRDCTITLNSACGNGICELPGNEHEGNCPQDCTDCDGSDPNCEE